MTASWPGVVVLRLVIFLTDGPTAASGGANSVSRCAAWSSCRSYGHSTGQSTTSSMTCAGVLRFSDRNCDDSQNRSAAGRRTRGSRGPRPAAGRLAILSSNPIGAGQDRPSRGMNCTYSMAHRMHSPEHRASISRPGRPMRSATAVRPSSSGHLLHDRGLTVCRFLGPGHVGCP